MIAQQLCKLWISVLSRDGGVGPCGDFHSLMRNKPKCFSSFPRRRMTTFHTPASTRYDHVLQRLSQISLQCISLRLSSRYFHARLCFAFREQVLGRRSPFPLILLPQFGGFWIEGTNHELSDGLEPEPPSPLSPSSRTKLECNTTATIFRKHFLGKVSNCVDHRDGFMINVLYISYSMCVSSHLHPIFESQH